MQERNVTVLKKGERLKNKYIIEDVLGEGGFGITYSGYDEVLSIRVAIKEYFPHALVTRNNEFSMSVSVSQTKYLDTFEEGKKKFLSEARTLAMFRAEEGIVSVNDFFSENNTAYIVMEYLEGFTLKEYLNGGNIFSMKAILRIMAPLFDSLELVHQRNLIHRDISPDNIMVLTNGKTKLMDFGSAREISTAGEKSMSIVIKHGYAPVEQYRSHGVQGPWTDVYALAATIYKCITSVTPVESIGRIMNDTVKPPSALGASIDPVQERALMKGMAVLRNDRYQTLAQFRDALYHPARDKKVRQGTGNSVDNVTRRAPVEMKQIRKKREDQVRQLSEEEMRRQFHMDTGKNSTSMDQFNQENWEDISMAALIILGVLTAVLSALLTIFLLRSGEIFSLEKQGPEFMRAEYRQTITFDDTLPYDYNSNI